MTFELIMLLGFLGTALFALLPAAPRQAPRQQALPRQRRSDGAPRQAAAGRGRSGRVKRREAGARLRNAGRQPA
jgi:hypothetical protein